MQRGCLPDIGKATSIVVPQLREQFNRQFTEAAYEGFLRSLEEEVGGPIEFRVCETPVFLPSELLAEMQQAAVEIIEQLRTPAYLELSNRAIPQAFNAPNEGGHPTFIQVDFAVTRDEGGELSPKLIELQGCASLYAYQLVLAQMFQRHYRLNGLKYLCGELTEESYLSLFRRSVLGPYSPRQVILMEIEPERQKTRPDFLLTEKLLGVPTVAITNVKKRDSRLYYYHEGRELEVRRIYNRVIVDELIRKGVLYQFDFRDELDVEWAGHPNWFFRISKFSIPFLKHPTVPRASFLSQLECDPECLDQYVLKPLFSFAGTGVKVNVTHADLEAIAERERANYLLQEKIVYAPVITTHDEPSKVEIRLMFFWPDEDAEPTLALTLARLSKGEMSGVDFNKNKTWVGSSVCFW